MERMESAVFDGTRLRHGNRVDGPAIVELPFTSIAVALGQTLECDAFGDFVLRLDQQRDRASGHPRIGVEVAR
jgi:N-methylhydantoinase A/oxoprolinase/acetone carboxylase beta subunit